MHTRFHRLTTDELERIVAFVDDPTLRVKGLDPGPLRHYRGGFGPFLGLGLAVLLWHLGRTYGLPVFVWATAPSLVAMVALRRLVQDHRAVRRSRMLLERDLHWYALAWTDSMFCYRSWEECVLEPWDVITDLRFFPDDGAGPLAGSLWVHFGRSRPVLVYDREGSFAGRKLDGWHRDLVAQWSRVTGRSPSS